MDNRKGSRKEQILQSLAAMLESSPGARITTSGLAKEVGVSEAALYRHFPSKAKMFEGLISFIEETIFSRISVIAAEGGSTIVRCEKVLTLLLTFTERNPGITRILTGDALAGETDRLRARVIQFYDRLESQLKQMIREAEVRERLRTRLPVGMAANLLLVTAEGKIGQYVRSEFKRAPTENWPDQWALLSQAVFVTD